MLNPDGTEPDFLLLARESRYSLTGSYPCTPFVKQVPKRHVDWEDLNQSTIERFTEALAPCHDFTFVYANPRFYVGSKVADLAFFAKARKCQRAWFRDAFRMLSSRIAYTKAEPEDQQYSFQGVMLFALDRILTPAEWRAAENDILPEGCVPSKRELIGHAQARNLLSSADLEPLVSAMLHSLRELLAKNPSATAYVTPRAILTFLIDSQQFLEAAWKVSGDWHGLRRRACRDRDFRGADNIPGVHRVMLSNGAFVLNGEVFAVKKWPSKGCGLPEFDHRQVFVSATDEEATDKRARQLNRRSNSPLVTVAGSLP